MTTKRPTPQQRRIRALTNRIALLEDEVVHAASLGEARRERIESLLDYFDQRFKEWGKERDALLSTIATMHKSVRRYENRIAKLEMEASGSG